jgi:hypothetical protein
MFVAFLNLLLLLDKENKTYRKRNLEVLPGNLIENYHFTCFRREKIGCASKARVNLPHIGNRECFKFVLKKSSLNLSKPEFVWEVPF